MNLVTAAQALVRRVFTKGEGERIEGPFAYVQVPQTDFIPMSWPLNFWQTGRDPLAGGSGAIVEACVWAYIRAIAQLPGYDRSTAETGAVITSPGSLLGKLLRYPNDYETSSDFLVHLVRSLLLHGNNYWPVTRNGRDEITGLHWSMPGTCQPFLIGVEGQAQKEIFYQIGNSPLVDFNSLVEASLVIPRRDVCHFKLMTPRHPLIGETWLQALAFELVQRGAMNLAALQFFKNMSRPSGVLTTDLVLNKAQVDELRERWNEQAKGMNAGGVPILTAGLQFKPVTASNADAQIIESLKLSDHMVAAVFGVPGILLNFEGAPAKTAEAVMSEWLASGLGFLINHIEVQIDQFFGLSGSRYVEYDTKALLRSLFRERIEGLVRGVQGAVFSPNEARREEGYSDAKDGDEPRVQQQVVPLSWHNEMLKAKTPLKPAPQPKVPPSEPNPRQRQLLFDATFARAMQENLLWNSSRLNS